MLRISVYERHKPFRFLATVKCPIPTLSLKVSEEKMWLFTSNFISYKTFDTLRCYMKGKKAAPKTWLFSAWTISSLLCK
jgi:hypothetical protein